MGKNNPGKTDIACKCNKPSDEGRPTLSRRMFLKGSLAAAGAAAVSRAPLAQAAIGETGKELATLIDLSKCVGCEACVEACRETNAAYFPEPEKPFPKMFPPRVKVSDWSENRDETDRLTPYNWLFVQHVEVEVNGEPDEVHIPRRCMHCVNPPCANLCPWGAARKLENGVVNIDPDICLGGSKCKKVCPWHIPQRQTGVGLYRKILPNFAGNGVMFKCNRCYERLAEGEKPACIDVCPVEAQVIGPRDEIVKLAHKRAEEINGYIYGEKENGGTNTLYVSPVKFEVLNEKIEKGPGKPHLDKVKNVMADAENLTVALLVAPLAGVAAAVGGLLKGTKKTKGEGDESDNE